MIGIVDRPASMARRDPFGIDHQFDFHRKISMRSLFTDLLTYDELARDILLGRK